jgi:glycosyltransferase involved in cell wall biosynthesis
MHVAFAHHEPIDANKARWVAMVRSVAAVAERERVTWFTPDKPQRVHDYAKEHLGIELPPNLEIRKLPHIHKLAGLTLNTIFFRACTKAVAESKADVLWLRSDKLAAHFAERKSPPMLYEAHLVGPLWAQDKKETDARVARLESIERKLYAGAAGVAAITRGLLDEIKDRYGFDGPAAIVPSGVDLKAFPPVWTGGNGRTVVYVGTLKFWKGLDALLDAIASAPELRLLLVGGGSDVEQLELEERIEALRIANRVELAGRLHQPEIPERVKRAACAVHPLPPEHSISSRFTSPLKVFEYLSMGLPVVAADVSSVREVLEDGVNARLYSAGDTVGLAEALTEVCTDKDLAAKLSAGGQESAKDFSYEARADRLLELMEDIR